MTIGLTQHNERPRSLVILVLILYIYIYDLWFVIFKVESGFLRREHFKGLCSSRVLPKVYLGVVEKVCRMMPRRAL